MYLEAKRKARSLCQAKCKAKRKRFRNIMQEDNQKCDVFKTAKGMVKTNQNINCEQCIRSDVEDKTRKSDEEKITAWKSYPEKLLNTEFVWDRNSLSQTDTVCGVPCFIEKDVVNINIDK